MIDAAELKQTMEKLQDVVPVLHPRLEELVQQADTLKQRAAALLEQFEEADVQGDGLFKEIDEELKGLQAMVATNREALVGALDQLESGVSELDDDIEEARAALQQGTEAAGAAMEDFRAQLEQGTEAARQAGESFREALEEVKQETEDARQALQSALDTAEDAAEAFQGQILAGQQAVDQTIDDLAEQIKQTQEAALEQLQGYLKAADELRQTFTDGLEGVLKDVIQEPALQLAEEMQQKIQNELKELVDGATGEVKEALGGLGEKILGAKEGSASGRELVEPLFDKLDEFFDPIKSVIDGVRSAAETVGIDF
jgi:chromosome segregation ATPase